MLRIREEEEAELPFAGYDTGVISGALVTIGSDLGPGELSSLQKVRIYVCLRPIT